jgi:hypothetical protein
MPPNLTVDTSDTRDCSKPLLFECAWEVANKGAYFMFLVVSSVTIPRPCEGYPPPFFSPVG